MAGESLRGLLSCSLGDGSDRRARRSLTLHSTDCLRPYSEVRGRPLSEVQPAGQGRYSAVRERLGSARSCRPGKSPRAVSRSGRLPRAAVQLRIQTLRFSGRRQTPKAAVDAPLELLDIDTRPPASAAARRRGMKPAARGVGPSIGVGAGHVPAKPELEIKSVTTNAVDRA
jgi:hypothetical protein